QHPLGDVALAPFRLSVNVWDALGLCGEEPLAFLTGRLAGNDIDRVGSDLDRCVGVGLEVVVPVGIRRGSALRGEYDIAPAVAQVSQRVDATRARLRAGVVQQQQRGPLEPPTDAAFVRPEF